MPNLTYKSLYTLVAEEIEKRGAYPSTSVYGFDQLSRSQILSNVAPSSRHVEMSSGDITNSLIRLLEDIIPPSIKSGLTVKQTSPISSSVIVKAGMGIIGGQIYSLNKDETIAIPFDSSTYVFFITLHFDGIKIERAKTSNKLTLAKIVVPEPGTTNRVKDRKADDYEWDAYIVNFKEYKLYGDPYGNLEEDSLEFLRDALGNINAETITGTLRLNENLKISNTAGTLTLNSNSLQLKDSSSNLLAKFNKNGVFFYNSSGVEIAKFGVDEAKVGNITITVNSIQSGNFLTNVSGFRIQDNGNAEFNDINVRGTIYTSVIAENLTIAEGVTFIGNLNLSESDLGVDAGYKLVLDRNLGADTYWVYNSATEYLEGWVDGSKRVEF